MSPFTAGTFRIASFRPASTASRARHQSQGLLPDPGSEGTKLPVLGDVHHARSLGQRLVAVYLRDYITTARDVSHPHIQKSSKRMSIIWGKICVAIQYTNARYGVNTELQV